MTEMNSDEAMRYFGFVPEEIGRNFEEWWVVSGRTAWLKIIGAKNGYLAVRARDGNTPDKYALGKKNFRFTYRKKLSPDVVYYFFEPL